MPSKNNDNDELSILSYGKRKKKEKISCHDKIKRKLKAIKTFFKHFYKGITQDPNIYANNSKLVYNEDRVNNIVELFYQLIFVFLFLIVIFTAGDVSELNSVHNSLYGGFAGTRITSLNYFYPDIDSAVNDIFIYMDEVALPSIFTNKYYSGKQYYNPREATEYKSWWFGDQLLSLGKVRLRQLRVDPKECEVPEAFSKVLDNCASAYSVLRENKGNFTDQAGEMHFYQSASDLSTLDINWMSPKTEIVYGSGGFVVDLDIGPRISVENLKQVKSSRWIDEYTRIVFIEMSFYNPTFDIFASVRHAVEFLGNGYLTTSITIDVSPILKDARAIMLESGVELSR